MENIVIVPKHFSIKAKQFKIIATSLGFNITPVPHTKSYSLGYDTNEQLISLGTALGQYVKSNPPPPKP